MSTKDDGGRAFPHYTGSVSSSHGMTLRDYFAGQALAACLQSTFNIEFSGKELREDWPVVVARCAYKAADAMLEARKP